MAVVNWPVTVSTSSELVAIPRMITELTIPDNCMNDPSFTALSFTDLNSLRTLSIGYHSLQYITSLSFSELNSLEHLWIGENALPVITTLIINSHSLNNLLALDLTPFPLLHSVVIDSYSLNNLVQLAMDGVDSVVIRERSLMMIEK